MQAERSTVNVERLARRLSTVTASPMCSMAFDDRKAESGATQFSRAGSVNAVEPLEDSGKAFGGDADIGGAE